MDGIIRFGSMAKNSISITFDDQKTDEEKIVQALDRGGVVLQGKQTPAQDSLFFIDRTQDLFPPGSPRSFAHPETGPACR